jgi:hypothetical protein
MTPARCLFTSLAVLMASTCAAQDGSAWQAIAGVPPGTKVRLSLKSHERVTDTLRGSTAEQVTVGNVVAKREDVLKLERFRTGGWSRGKTAAVGALIGGGAGAAIGVASDTCHRGDIICIPRAAVGGVLGAAGAIVGAVIGALVPHHRTDVVYEAR